MYKKTKSLGNKTRNSSKKIFNEREERWIVKEIKKNPFLSAPNLAKMVEERFGKIASPETISRILRKYKFHRRTARNKPFVSQKNRWKSKNFAETRGHKDFNYWKTVIYADESKFNLFKSDGKVCVWRKPNTELQEKNLRPTVKHSDSVMVWACMAASGVGNLEFIDGIMGNRMYLGILRRNLKESALKLGLQNNFTYYQDNDPKHKTENVRLWLVYNCPHLIETLPQSPDLNVIENLWDHLDDWQGRPQKDYFGRVGENRT